MNAIHVEASVFDTGDLVEVLVSTGRWRDSDDPWITGIVLGPSVLMFEEEGVGARQGYRVLYRGRPWNTATGNMRLLRGAS